jgi:hypothetical protein
MSINPIARSPEEFGALHGICRAQVYKELNAGKIIGRKNGRRTLIYDEDNLGYRESLPVYTEETRSPPRGRGRAQS